MTVRRLLRRLVKPRSVGLLGRSLALTLVVTAAATAFAATHVGDRLEQRTVEARFAERGPLDTPPDVVVVAIDRQQDSYANQWPLNRDLYAMAIANLDKAGVAGIVFATPMNYPAQNPTENAKFRAAIEQSSAPVVLSARAGAVVVRGLDGADELAHGRPARDLDGGAARTAVVRGRGGEHGLGAELLEQVAADGDALKSAPATLPINFYGGRGSFEHVSFADVAYGLTQLQDLRGKLVVIGPTEGIARDDLRVPVGGGRMSAAEVEANVLANLLDRSWLREPSAWGAAAAALALALTIWALVLVVPLVVAVPASFALLGGWAWLAVAAFDRGVVLPMLAPLATGALVFTTLSLVLATLSVRDRIRVKSLFARYVHADVVRALLDGGEDHVEFGGEEREITVLFSDIRGFTTLSEQVDATEMVAQLNEYFQAMVEVVTEHEGAVDKFLGDGLMAIFGAPVSCEPHAARACDAATAMLIRLEAVNADREHRGLAPLKIGIGIHTGKAVVGNVGSPPFRVDFTAIGDTVNLAARLEAMTKELGALIVVSGATVDACRQHEPGCARAFTGLGSVVARGRSEATDVFELHASTHDATTHEQRDAA